MEIILFDGLVFNNFTGEILDEQSNSNGHDIELSKTTLSLLEDIDKEKLNRLKFVESLKRMISELSDEERDVLKEIIHIANIPDESTDFYIFADLHDFGYDNEYTGQCDRLLYVINGKINEYKKGDKR
jgi:heme oxygenase